ncbi:GxxExxY protein [Wenzhouxiangella sp. EGI_FJ10305]|uniref:GxxExxY protein n=1 Tax=Wenzhouxiangella sp. EGI_FJ10305 TaxID=3243768 RepID=UPI0035E36E6A
MDTDKEKHLLSDVSEKVIGCCYEVGNTLGAGFLESVYENALSVELVNQGIDHQRQVQVDVQYKGTLVGRYQPDFLVEKRLVVEIKALRELTGQHQAQVLNYLKATGLDVGLLVNFGSPKVQVKRLVN